MRHARPFELQIAVLVAKRHGFWRNGVGTLRLIRASETPDVSHPPGAKRLVLACSFKHGVSPMSRREPPRFFTIVRRLSELDSAGFSTPLTGSPFLRADSDQFFHEVCPASTSFPSKPNLDHLKNQAIDRLRDHFLRDFAQVVRKEK
jgi:hypothetical protein